NLPGPDHKASLEPDELKAMVSAIRNIELAVSGSGVKEPSNSEKPNKTIARKSIHLAMHVKVGETIQSSHLIMKRPGDGISPMLIEQIVGKIASKDLQEDTKLKLEDIIT
ncbi:MAG: N-acetylneuraminate synthase, partial [Bacteroidetes bacterium]|nr:N-acetylneuraminate synthase [Bacteroidota bacterium]